MPARLNPRQDERSRSAIQTTQLCKRLNYFALGLPEPATGRPPEMSDTQVRAALGLLRKTLPDLSATQLASADGDGNPIVLHLIAARVVSDEIQTSIQTKTPQTIEHAPAPQGDLLDQPLPEE